MPGHMGGMASMDGGLSMTTSMTSPLVAPSTAFLVMSCGLGHESPRQSMLLATVTVTPPSKVI